jgi:hypothetical protein
MFYSKNTHINQYTKSVFLQSFSADFYKNELATVANTYFKENPEKFGDDLLPSDENFIPFPNIDALKKIGENSTNKEEEIIFYNRLAKNQDIVEVYEKIDLRIHNTKYNEQNNDVINSIIPVNTSLKNVVTNDDEITSSKILKKIIIPPTRAENIPLDEQIEYYYLRNGMADIFNWDKFIISGSKGTGKTFLYQTMENRWVQKELCSSANEVWSNYLFVNLIPILENNKKEKESFVDADNFADYENIPNFYNKFWIIFTANLLFNKPQIKAFLKENNLKIDTSWCIPSDLKSVEYARELGLLLQNIEKIINIERQLTILDQYLANNQKTLLIFYDQLDHFVKPTKWRDWISNLIKYWRGNPFTNIQPKIFLRSDLLRTKIEAVNSTEINRRTVKIEWTGDELFAYFFTTQFKHNKDTLLNYFRSRGLQESILNQIDDKISNDFYIPTDKEILEPLVNIFFEKSAHRENPNDFSYGEVYTWFEKNLQDGQDDLSLRPFLWLLEQAQTEAIGDKNYENNSKYRQAILSAKYFAAFNTMEEVGEKYYNDIANEEGNSYLNTFKNFLHTTQKIKRVGTYTLKDWEELMTIFLADNKTQLSDETVKSFTSFLYNNGIVREVRTMGGKYTNYEIPFVYKYHLFLDNK